MSLRPSVTIKISAVTNANVEILLYFTKFVTMQFENLWISNRYFLSKDLGMDGLVKTTASQAKFIRYSQKKEDSRTTINKMA